MIKTIGFIGSGAVNSRLAKLAINAGLNVVLSNSRGSDTLIDLVSELGERAKAVTPKEAAEVGDIVVVSIPFGKYDRLPVESLAGKVVVDTMNYYAFRDGQIDILDNFTITSSELVQEHLKGAHVVKALFNLDVCHLSNGAKPYDKENRWALPITGNEQAAKEKVSEFMDLIGYEAVDCGTLADSWKIEVDTPIYIVPYVGEVPNGMTKEEGMKWYSEDAAAQVTREKVIELVSKATRKEVGIKTGGIHQQWLDILENYPDYNVN